MTIIFSNNDFKYEIEAVTKMFFPAQSFRFLYDEFDFSDDYIFTRIKFGTSYTYFFVCIFANGIRIRKSLKIDGALRQDKQTLEHNLSKLLYVCLENLTGISQKWGMLTGIRPVRKILNLMNQNLDKNQIFSKLKNDFFVSDEKLNLACQIAQIQHKILKNTSRNDVSLYVSIPFCPSRCSYCSFVSHSIKSAFNLIPDYVDCLCKELEILGDIIQKYQISIKTVYIGGGTPTSLDTHHLQRILQCISDNFNISDLSEYNVEAGRPDTITTEKLMLLKHFNVSRISVNPQSLNDDVLKTIGRNHSAEDAVNSFMLAKNSGFDNINMDLIAGLPSDSLESFADTLNRIISLHPESITIHTLTLKRSSSLYADSNIHINNPAPDMLSYAYKTLDNSDYLPYYLYRQKNTVSNLENSGFSLKNKECLYNILIMDDTHSIIGAGAGASTKFVYPDNFIKRIHNYKFPYEYISRFGLLMDKKNNGILNWIHSLNNAD